MLPVLAALALSAFAPSAGPSVGVATVAPHASAGPPGSAYAVIRTIAVGASPTEIAVNYADDTVYVTNYDGDNVSVIDGRTGHLTDDTIVVGDRPRGVAVDQNDDTVYVANYYGNSLSVINGRDIDDSRAIPMGGYVWGVAADDVDDTVYVAVESNDSVAVLNGRDTDDSRSVSVGMNPVAVAVDQADDTVYVANSGGNSLTAINGRDTSGQSTVSVGATPSSVALDQADDTIFVTNLNSASTSIIAGRHVAPQSSVAVGASPWGAAVNQADGAVFITNNDNANVSVVDGRSGLLTDDTITVGPYPAGIASDDAAGRIAGLVYVVVSGEWSVAVIAEVSPVISAFSGTADDLLTLSLEAGLPDDYTWDDSAVSSVSFGQVTVPATHVSGNAWHVRVPAGTGTVAVSVDLDGGQIASAGTFTYSAPSPPVVRTPSAPQEVSAVAGDRSAEVAWSAPADSGSYPVSTYEVAAAPGEATCLVGAPALSCPVRGLINGTTYTFSVRALNGAGWSPAGGPSNAVTAHAEDEPTIRLARGPRTSAGARDRIVASGTASGMEPGQRLTVHIKTSHRSGFVEGKAVVAVGADGTFAWSRLISKSRRLAAYMSSGEVRSKRVVWTPIR